MTTASISRTIAFPSTRDVAVVGIGVVLLLVSFLGATWLVLPAGPVANAPLVPADFNDLATATAASPSAVQAAYFAWLAWVVFGALIVLSVAVLLTNNRFVAVAGAAMGLIAAIFTTFAIKGPQTWTQTIDALPNLRFGGYLVVVGLLILLIFNAVKAARSNH